MTAFIEPVDQPGKLFFFFKLSPNFFSTNFLNKETRQIDLDERSNNEDLMNGSVLLYLRWL